MEVYSLFLLLLAITCTATNSLEPNSQQLPEISVKVGRKERCRHVVRKEVAKYSEHVKRLAARIRQLKRDLFELRSYERTQSQLLETLRNNVTSQQSLLTSTIEQLNKLSLTLNNRQTDFNLSTNTIPKDCEEVYRAGGLRYSGTYVLDIQPTQSQPPFQVLCDRKHNAGWIVVQNRYDGSENFRRSWQEYKDGFGRLQYEFWLGNDKLNLITSSGNYTLRIELLEYSGREFWAEYQTIKVSDEADGYRLHLTTYSGNAGDSLSIMSGAQFSTFDHDADFTPFDNCAQRYPSGWWYKSCEFSNINGRYLDESERGNVFLRDGIVWDRLHAHKSLKETRMLLKPLDSI